MKTIIRQNQKAALLEFLFGSTQAIESTYPGSSPALDHKIQNLQNQVNFLQQKIIDLEVKLENPKYALIRVYSNRLQCSRIIENYKAG